MSSEIRLHNLLTDIEAEEDGNGEDLTDNQRMGNGYHITRGETRRASERRDEIAQQMWDGYIARRER
jgi:hypothetical protein